MKRINALETFGSDPIGSWTKVVAPTPPGVIITSVGDQAGDASKALGVFDDSGTIKIQLWQNFGSWVKSFERVPLYNTTDIDIDLYDDVIVIGYPYFSSTNEGKIEIWTLNRSVSSYSASKPEKGWIQVPNSYVSMKGPDECFYGIQVFTDDGINVYVAGETSANYYGRYELNDETEKILLKRTTASLNSNIAELSTGCYTMIASNDATTIYDNIKNVTLRPMINTDAFRVKSFVDEISQSNNQIIYGPNAQIGQTVQTNKTAVSLFFNTSAQMQFYNYDTLELVDAPMGIVVYQDMSTYDFQEFTTLSSPKAILSGMNFAYVSELPLDTIDIDSETDSIYGDTFNLQNYLNQSYDTNGGLSAGTGEVRLYNTRDYKKIGADQFNVWISYTPTINYMQEGTITKVEGASSYELSTYVIEDLPVTSLSAYNFQYIERVQSINKKSGANAHKSNVFSIEIKDSYMNDAMPDSNQKTILRDTVERAIREFTKKVIPAHTQLWKIKWSGK